MDRGRAGGRRANGALAAALAALALAGPAPARAEEAGGASADELFRKAGKAYDAGDYKTAHSLYSKAFARRKTHDVAAMLGQTEMKLGKPCEAAEHLAYAVETFPPSLVDERRARILRAQAAVKKAIGTLRVEARPAGAAVQVDFQPVPAASLPGPFCVAAGDRVVFVTRDGFAVERRTVTVEPGAEVTLTVELRRVAKEAGDGGVAGRAGAPLVSRPADAATPFLIGVLSAGLGGLAAGAVLLPIAQAKHDAADRVLRRIDESGAKCSFPTDYSTQCQRLRSLRNDEVGFLNAGVASLITGFVLATAAGGFLLFRPPAASPRPEGPRVTVGAAPGGAGVVLTGEF